VSAQERDGISLVLPTYNRAEALRTNLGSMLAIRDVAEVIVVDDGSTDDTLQIFSGITDDRLRVISHPVNRGVAAARNTGVDAASGDWVLFGEDDCRFPGGYATALRAEAERHEADIVGATLVHGRAEDSEVPQIVASAPRRERPSPEDIGVFPLTAIETPFLNALSLVRKAVFKQVRFHESFSVNGYREETDFFVQAARAGFRCVLTPATYSYQLETWDGGQHQSSTLRYEYWALRNNWLFLRRHGAWLAEHNYIPGTVRAQLQFAVARLRAVFVGASYVRMQKAREVLGMGSDSQRATD
jgi:glycosyltransferase involved in cell wall biosynthesis